MNDHRSDEQAHEDHAHHPHSTMPELHPVPEGTHAMRHAFILVGDRTRFIVHMTMFDMEAHCYQCVAEVALSEHVEAELRALRSFSDPRKDKTVFVGTKDDDGETIAQLGSGIRTSFKADVFVGIPDRAKGEGWPWKDTDLQKHLMQADVVVTVTRIVFARHMDFALRPPQVLTYLLFGRGDEAHMTNYQFVEPEFDHVLSLTSAPDWLPSEKLIMGSPVSVPTRELPPASGGTYCQDPLGQGRHKVRYAGQGRERDIDVCKTWWCSAAIVNFKDPCTQEEIRDESRDHDCSSDAIEEFSKASRPNPHKPVWEAIFKHGDPKLKRFQQLNSRLPASPRCKLCYAPYRGAGGWLMRLLGRQPSSRNPLYCSLCDKFLRGFPGGAEIDMTVLFVDVRNSTGWARRGSGEAFMGVMSNFYDAVIPVLNRHDGFIADVRSDSVLATFPPGMSGPNHARKALAAVDELLRLEPRSPRGEPILFGCGMHTAPVWIGTMTGRDTGFEGISAEGIGAIVASRLCGKSGACEALLSTDACLAAGLSTSSLPIRRLMLKGIAEAVVAHVRTGMQIGNMPT